MKRYIKHDNYGVEILTMLIRKGRVKTLYNLLDVINRKHNELSAEKNPALSKGCNFFYKLKWHKKFLNSNTIKEELRLLYKLPLPTDLLNAIKQYILFSY